MNDGTLARIDLWRPVRAAAARSTKVTVPPGLDSPSPPPGELHVMGGTLGALVHVLAYPGVPVVGFVLGGLVFFGLNEAFKDE
jgi:hypothetical protein